MVTGSENNLQSKELPLDHLWDRNSEFFARNYSPMEPRIFNATRENLKEIADIGKVPEFATVINGKASSKDLPDYFRNPSLLNLSMQELSRHAVTFDQEGSNVIAQVGSHYYVLQDPYREGYYDVLTHSYTPGGAIKVEGAKIKTTIHSHPKGRMMHDEQSDRDKKSKVTAEQSALLGNFPSINDLSGLLLLNPEHPLQDVDSIIMSGPRWAVLIARTLESPEKKVEIKGEFVAVELFKEMLGLRDENIVDPVERQADLMQKILTKYQLAMYYVPMNDLGSLFWDRVYPSKAKDTAKLN